MRDPDHRATSTHSIPASRELAFCDAVTIEDPVLTWRAASVAGVVVVAVSAASLAFFYTHGWTNLYGDALAHMENARRLTDSATPGLEEIGSVWLPLFHLLTAPLAMNDHLWRTGLAGSLVSTVALAVAAGFVFRLGFALNRSLASAWVALAGFLLCANMLYIASAPLTEPLCVMWAVALAWALYRFQHGGSWMALSGAGLAAFFGALTRYDGWFLIPFAGLFVLLARPRPWSRRILEAAVFGAIACTAPLLWTLHSLQRYGNLLEFFNGPNSAVAIYQHQLAITGFRYPTDGSFLLSARYYLEDLKLVVGPVSLELLLLGLIVFAVDSRLRARRAAALLLLVPFVFYVQSMARSSIPIYVPTLFPNTFYNLRYGLEMLPAAALFPSFLVSARLPRPWRLRAAFAVVFLLALQFGFSLRHGASEIGTLKESLLNTPCNTRVSRSLVEYFREQYRSGTILLANGKYPCLLPTLGISYRNTVTEENRRYWSVLPLGPEQWLAGTPLGALAWIITTDDDVVDKFIRTHPDVFRDFERVERYQFPGEEPVSVYQRKSAATARIAAPVSAEPQRKRQESRSAE